MLWFQGYRYQQTKQEVTFGENSMKLYIRSSLNKSAYRKNPVIVFKPDVVRNSIDWKEWFGEDAPTYNIGKLSDKELGQLVTKKDSKGKHIIDGIHVGLIQYGPNGNAEFGLVADNERSYNKILPYINEVLNSGEVESSIMVNPSAATIEATDRIPIVPTIYEFYDEHEDEELEDFYNALDARDEEAYKILSNASDLWLCYIGKELDHKNYTYRICDTLEAYHDMVQSLAIKDGIDVYKVGNHYDIVGLYNGFSEEENTLHMYPLTKENADIIEENLTGDMYEEDEVDYLNSVRGVYWDI